MTLSNPSNSSPLSYGVLSYGTSLSDMPTNVLISGNEIFGIAGSAISLGSYTHSHVIENNNLHDICKNS